MKQFYLFMLFLKVLNKFNTNFINKIKFIYKNDIINRIEILFFTIILILSKNIPIDKFKYICILCDSTIHYNEFYWDYIFKIIYNYDIKHFFSLIKILKLKACWIWGIWVLIMEIIFINYRNIKRKLIHITIFLVFINLTPHEANDIINCMEVIMILSIWTSRANNFKILVKNFTNENDTSLFVLSHVYLLECILFSYYFLKYELFLKSLINLCILDTFASLTKDFKTHKTRFDFILGQISCYIIAYKQFNEVIPLFYFIGGIIEWYSKLNDNLFLTLYSVIYYKYIYNIINLSDLRGFILEYIISFYDKRNNVI